MKIERCFATYLAIILVSFLAPCLSSCGTDPYIYDRYEEQQNQKTQNTGQPSYQPNPYQQNQYPNPYQQNPYQQQNQYPNPYQQNPYQQNPYQRGYQAPRSLYYSDPYAIQQSPYYNYDADQYYVPPIGYGSDNNQGANRIK